MSRSLKHCSVHYSESSRNKVYAYDPESRHAILKHLGRCVKDHEKLVWYQLEQGQTNYHEDQSKSDALFSRLFYPLFVSCSEVESYDGKHSLVKSEHRHENEALDLEIYSENCDRSG